MLTQHHILVVEDDESMRRKLVYILHREGYQITEAPDGKTALELLQEHYFDVVLTDIVMGSISGIEVLHQARQLSYPPEVILLTGHGTLDTAIEAVHAGAHEYLLKPCTTEKIQESVSRAIQTHVVERRKKEAAIALSQAFALYSEAGTFTYSSEGSRSLSQRLPPAAVSVSQPLPPASLAEGIAQSSTPSSFLDDPERFIRIGYLLIGESRSEVFFRGSPVQLTPIEFSILNYLGQYPNQVCSCRDIVYNTHNMEHSEADAQGLLRSHVRNLRKKINPSYILTDRGHGYKLVDPEKLQDL